MNESRELFQNTKRSDYRRHAVHSDDTRKTVAVDMVPVVYGYFIERQPEGYVWKFGKPERPKCLPTLRERMKLERLADYMLAEDLADGLTLTDRFREESDEECLEFPPLGGAARAYQDMELNLLTPEMLAKRKTCDTCLSYFIDTSPGFNAKRCGPRCLRWSEKLRKRRSRNNGDDRRMRDRERQQLEYPFYSPYELEHINTFPERCYSDESIDRKVQAGKRGGRKKPQSITMDSVQVSAHFKPYTPNEKGESGPMTVTHRRPEVIARYLRMKYGKRRYTPDIHTHR